MCNGLSELGNNSGKGSSFLVNSLNKMNYNAKVEDIFNFLLLYELCMN